MCEMTLKNNKNLLFATIRYIHYLKKMGEVYRIPQHGKSSMKIEASRNMADLAC